jgi:FMN phosphatase YigB (HAD superfamily)
MNLKKQVHIVFDLHNVLFKPNYYRIFCLILKAPSKMRLLSYLFRPGFLSQTVRCIKEYGLGQGSFLQLQQHYPFLAQYESTVTAIASAQYPVEAAFDLVRLLKQRYPVHILSNMGIETLMRLKKAYPDYFSLFDEIHHFGPATAWTQKPQVHTYQTLLNLLQIEPSQMVFIDNSKRNIQAAQALGIVAIRYTSISQVKEALKKLKLI